MYSYWKSDNISCHGLSWIYINLFILLYTDLDTKREMAEEYKTPAAKALRKHYDELVSVIQEPDLPTLGAGFFSLEVISRQTMEMVGNVATSRTVRISKLLLAMMSHLDLHPEKFDSVMDVLKQELVYARDQ